jgi:excisionase family DNA binding protein
METRSTKAKPTKLKPEPKQRPITVTIPNAREISGLGVSTLWKLISEGRLDTVSVGRRRLILYDSLEKLLSPGDGGGQ